MLFAETPEGRLAVALGIGLVVGAERERRKVDGPRRLPAGIRTFALVALVGGVIGLLGSPGLLVAGALIVATFGLVAYLVGDRGDPGLTTELALVLTFCLGALAIQQPKPALACGLCAATLLAFRTTLHAAIRSVVREEELRDALLLGVAAIVILPLLPNRAIDSLGVVNPFRLWRLVVAFMAMAALGHVAQRAVGPRYGLALAGFVSGFVSSAATIAAMGSRARSDASQFRPAVAGAAASSVATLIELEVLVAAADPHLAMSLAWPVGAGSLVAIVYAALQTVGSRDGHVGPVDGHGFKISTAFAFVGLVTGVSLVSTLAARKAGAHGLLLATAIAGFADTHSAAAAVASVSGAGKIAGSIAELGVLAAFTTNTLTKCILAVAAGGRRFATRIVISLLLMLAVVWGGYLFGR